MALAALVALPICTAAMAGAAGAAGLTITLTSVAVSLSGTITYSGSYGPVSISRPIRLWVFAHPPGTGGGPVADGNVTTNGGAFDVSLPSAGTYYLVYWLDVNNDGSLNAGEPLGVYNGRTTASSADPITVPQTGFAGLEANFGDTLLAPGVAGTATYTGSLGPVSESVPIAVVPYPDPDLTVEAPGRLVGRATTNGGRYDLVLTGTVYLIAFLDLDDSGDFEHGDPFTIYNGRCSTPGDPVQAGPDQTDINFTFGDENLQPCPTPTPISCVGDCNGNGHVTVDEILTMVNIALGNAQVSACEAGDANGDNQITIDEILAAVNNALNGCE